MSEGNPHLPVAIGDVVADKYRVERLIGRGGMGSVFQATHVQLLQRVALKFLASAVLKQEDARTRFLREARAAAALSSEHVARVIDVGVLATGNVPYLVIEYLEGEDLASRLERGPVPFEEAVRLMMQACDALGEAHRIGIVHRDIKPHNLFLVRRPTGAIALKVLDFGIAKIAHPALESAEVITGTCAVMGTPQYMAPEQMASTRTVEAAADVWALGVCLYECLTKRRPFESGNMLELGALVMNGSPTAITNHRGDLPPSLVAVIDRCLAKDPTRRYPDANALHEALASSREKAAVVVTPPTLMTPQFPPQATPRASGPPGAPGLTLHSPINPIQHSPRPSGPPAAPQLPTSTSFGESNDFRPAPAPAPKSSSRLSTAIGLGLLGLVVATAIGVKIGRHSTGPAETTAPDPPPAALVAPPPATTSETAPAPSPSVVILTAAPPSATASTPPISTARVHHPAATTPVIKKTTPTAQPTTAPTLTSAPAVR